MEIGKSTWIFGIELQTKKREMKISSNEKVNGFLEGLRIADSKSSEIIESLRELVFNTYPTVEEKMMYGGILFSVEGEMFSGLFAYKNHVSMEFGNGYRIEDVHNVLEGKGKFRRHIKFSTLDDVEGKHALAYIQRSI